MLSRLFKQRDMADMAKCRAKVGKANSAGCAHGKTPPTED